MWPFLFSCSPTPSAPSFDAGRRVASVATPDVTRLVDLQAAQILEGGTPEAQAPVELWHLETSPLRIDGSKPAPTYDVPVTGGSRVRVAAMMQTEKLVPAPGAAGASFEVHEVDAAGRVLVRHTYLRRLTGDTGSTPIATTFELHRRTERLQIQPVHANPAQGARGHAILESLVVQQLDPLEPFLTAPTKHDQPLVHRIALQRDSRMAWTLAGGTTIEQEVPPGPDRHLRFALGSVSRNQACVAASIGTSKPMNVCSPRKGRWSEHRVFVGASSKPRKLRWQVPTGNPVFIANPTIVPIEPTPPSQNVVLIVVDTLRGDAVSWAGGDTTPGLASLAADSLVFDHAFSTSSWTAPSMGSIVTSTYPLQHGTGLRVPFAVQQNNRNNSQLRKNELNYQVMDRGRNTLAEHMYGAGFETVGFYTNYFFSSQVGFDQGFERYEQYSGSRPDGAEPGGALVKRWLEQRSSARPFFLTFHVVDPHLPYFSRKEVAKSFPPADVDGLEMIENGTIAKLPHVSRKAKRTPERIRAVYDDDIRWADRVLQSVVDELKRYDPNVAIILTADHGEAFGEHGAFVHGNVMYKELVHVPMLVHAPQHGLTGLRHDPVSLIDVAPTLAAVAGIEADPAWKGTSLLEPIPERSLLMTGMYQGPERASVIRWPHKLAWMLPERQAGFSPNRGKVLLTDLSNDFSEAAAIDDPALEASLLGEIVTHMQQEHPGLHIACAPGDEPLQVTVSSKNPVRQLLTPTLEDDDTASLLPNRRGIQARLQGDDADWMLLRSRYGMDGSTVTVAGENIAIGTAPEPPPSAGCVAWLLESEGHMVGENADADALDQLKLLGYVE